MAVDTKHPRGIVSTFFVALIIGLFAGLLWIGRIRLAVVVLVGVCLLMSLAIVTIRWWPPLPWFLADGLVLYLLLVAVTIAVPLVLRARSRPHPTYSRLWVVVLLGIVASIGSFTVPAAIRLFLYQPFSMPSGSMLPTMLPGDRFMVSTRVYRRGGEGTPFASLIFGEEEPERGDIVVFRHPVDRHPYVKRLIGKPGDTVQMRDGRVVLNGVVLPQKRSTDYRPEGDDRSFEMYLETLPNGRSYSVLNLVDGGTSDDTRLFQVPPGHYFFLGDNRDNSADSRFTLGVVPRDHFIGKAIRVFGNTQGDLDRARQNLMFQ